MISAKITGKTIQTVNRVSLLIKPSKSAYSWISGQWVDFTVPEFIDTYERHKDKNENEDSVKKGPPVGGYSFCSPTNSGSFELLVQRSNHPVTNWLFEKGQVGDDVLIGAASGSCVYIPEKHDPDGIVCIAGGVGITPLISMIRTAKMHKKQATLYHGVTSREDQLFASEIPAENIFISSEGRRISFEAIGEKHGPSIDYFLCGPERFIDQGELELKSVGCHKVHFEKWW